MLPRQQCGAFLNCSFELWLRFIAYVFKALARLQSPLTIRDGDLLAKELFSGHVKKSGGLTPSAFLINGKSAFGISTDRWSKAPERLFVALGLASATRRKDGSKFKGFARFDTASLKSIKLEDSWQMRALGVPTLRNPFHADIPLPVDKGDDYYLYVATELVARATPIPYTPS